jgi:hypothetical protein
MTITREPDGTRRCQFDQANPNFLPDLFRKMALGSYLQGQDFQVRRQVGTGAAGSNQLAANNNNLPALTVLTLPDGGKCSLVYRCTVRASGVVNGEFAPQVYGTTPITRQVAPTPNGDLAFLGLDAVTDADVIYVPERGDVIEIVLPVTLATGVCTLPAWLTTRGVVLLEEAVVLEGTVLGPKIVLVPAAGAPAAGFVQLSVAKTLVQFDPVADIPTRVSLKFLVVAEEQLADVLEASSDTQ